MLKMVIRMNDDKITAENTLPATQDHAAGIDPIRASGSRKLNETRKEGNRNGGLFPETAAPGESSARISR